MDNQIFERLHKWKYILIPLCIVIYLFIKNYDQQRVDEVKFNKICEAYANNEASKEDLKNSLKKYLKENGLIKGSYQLTENDRSICEKGWQKAYFISNLEQQEQNIAIKKLDPNLAEDQFSYLMWATHEKSPRIAALIELYYEKIIACAEIYKAFVEISKI